MELRPAVRCGLPWSCGRRTGLELWAADRPGAMGGGPAWSRGEIMEGVGGRPERDGILVSGWEGVTPGEDKVAACGG
jgi:hypothetical protein